MAKSHNKPPLKHRPIFVQYIAIRRCRYNPSWGRFDGLPELQQNFLLEKVAKRGDKIPETGVSIPPTTIKKETIRGQENPDPKNPRARISGGNVDRIRPNA